MGGGKCKKKKVSNSFPASFSREFTLFLLIAVVLCFCFLSALIANMVLKSESAFATTE